MSEAAREIRKLMRDLHAVGRAFCRWTRLIWIFPAPAASMAWCRPRPWQSWRWRIEKDPRHHAGLDRTFRQQRLLAKAGAERVRTNRAAFAVIRHGGSHLVPARQTGQHHPGCGQGAVAARLERDGFATIGHLQDAEPRDPAPTGFGATGLWLVRIARAQDSRAVDPGGDMKTISSETTFNSDLSRPWPTWEADTVAPGSQERYRPGRRLTIFAAAPWCWKLKTANFRLLTRSASLEAPTQLADKIFRTAQDRAKEGSRWPALSAFWVSAFSNLASAAEADPFQSDRSGERQAGGG